jgi:hypothetical protein
MSGQSSATAAFAGGERSRRVLVLAAVATVAVMVVVGLLRQQLGGALSQSKPTAASTLSPEHSAISRLLGADQRPFWAVRTRAGLRQRNAGQGLRVTYGRSGPLVHSVRGTVGIGLSLVGRGVRVDPAQAVAPVAARNRVSYDRGNGVVEWYANGPLGLEQGVTVASRPLSRQPGRLRFVFALRGSLVARIEHDVVTFGPRGGLSSQALLRYLGLSVTDARGRVLPAQLSLAGGRLTIGVNDAGAHYPITVDPTLEAVNLTESNGNDEDRFGSSIAQSASGSLVVVGAPGDGSATDLGGAYVFVEPAAGWAAATQTTELTDPNASEEFGTAVAVVGTSIAVGAPYANDFKGYVDVWAQPAKGWSNPGSPVELSASDAGTEGAEFGSALAASGTQLFVGAPEAGTDAAGAVYEFNEPAGGWTTPTTQTAELTAAGSAGLGRSVAADGSTVVAGAPSTAPNPDDYTGAAYVFTMPSGGWGAAPPVPAELTASDGSDTGPQLGWSVAINAASGTIAVGAPYQGSDYTGSVYVYQEPAGGWASEEQTAEMSGTVEDFWLGYVVAITNAAGTGPPTPPAGAAPAHPTSAGWSIGVVSSEWNAGVVLLFPASNGTWSNSSGGTHITFGIPAASPYSLSVQPSGIAIGNWEGNWFGNGGTVVESGSGYEIPASGYTISGTLTNENCGCGSGPTPASDINVAVTSSGGVSTSGTSNDKGVWSVDVPNGDYTVTPDDSTYSWNPTSQSVTVDGANQDNIDFDTCGNADETGAIRRGEPISRATGETGHCTVTTVKCTDARFPLPSDCFVAVEARDPSDGPPKGSAGVGGDGSITFTGAGAGGCGQLIPVPGAKAKSYCTFSILSKPGRQHLSVDYFPLSKDWHISEGSASFTIAPPRAGSTKKDVANWLVTDAAIQTDVGTVMLDLGTGGGGGALLYQSQTAAKVTLLEALGQKTAAAALKYKAAAAVEVTATAAAIGGIQKYGLSNLENLLAGYIKDPPDVNYRVVAKPHPNLAIPTRYRHVFDQRDVDGVYRAAAELRALASATSTAVNRATTAGKKGAAKSRNMQVKAAIKYLAQMAKETDAMIADQTRLAHALARTPVGKYRIQFKSPTLSRQLGHLTFAQLFDDPTELARLRHAASLYLTASKDPAPLAFPKLPALFP